MHFTAKGTEYQQKFYPEEWQQSEREKKENIFEQLYDMDPEHFAQMPTSEFMTAAHEFAELSQQIDDAKRRALQFEETYGLKIDI